MECRSTVGLPTLDRPIGVRIPALQPKREVANLSFFCVHSKLLRGMKSPGVFTRINVEGQSKGWQTFESIASANLQARNSLAEKQVIIDE